MFADAVTAAFSSGPLLALSRASNLSSAQYSGPSSPHAPATTMIKEDADDGSNPTQIIENGRRGDGDGRGAARVCAADWARRSCHVLLRKRPRSHPLRGGRVR